MAGRGELDLIAQIRGAAKQRSGAVRLGIGDDCAVLRLPAGHDVLVTTDLSMEGVHFRRDWHPARSAGHRCLLRGLSDVAAMGGRPMAAFLSLALPGTLRSTAEGRRWVDGFLAGLLDLAERTGTPLAGGDTSASPDGRVLADIVLLGSAPRGTELRRSGARPGDTLYVTGSLGGSAAELDALAARPSRYRTAKADETHPHLFPVPRLAVGERLRRSKIASACIDLSDGLATDLRHLCAESGVGARIDPDALPYHPMLAGRPAEERSTMALRGGEDYELLFAAAKGTRVPRRIAGAPVTRIGTVTRGSGLFVESPAGPKPLPGGGWEHSL